MKKKLLIVAVLIAAYTFGQSDSGDPGSGLETDLIPYPTSPEAAKLGVFGNVPVNLSAGQMNYQIPLHTLKVNGYSWPITLNYSYGGLILEDKPSLSGMSWNLSAGGTVVREVRGLPDEHPKGYYGAQNIRFTHLKPYFDNGEITESTIDQMLSGRMDSEADKFTLSINGINFSFKIDKDKNPVYLSKHNFKVSITWLTGYIHQIDKFTLIDDKGYTYIFDVKERNEPVGNSVIFNDSFTGYTSSWMLSKVIFPNTEEISFSYVDDFYESLDFYASGFFSYNVPNIQCAGGPGLLDYTEGFSKTLIKRKLLGGILSSNGNIFMPVDINSDRKRYNAIVINNSQNNTIASYGFDYYGARDVLTSITKNNQPFYTFDYYKKDNIPDYKASINARPYAQDRWGFFNGVANTFAINMPYTQYSANKTPNPDKAKIGALTKIIYPTGGYSIIDYEANQIKTNYVARDTEQALLPNREILVKLKSDNVFTTTGNDYKERSVIYTFKTDVYASIAHRITSNQNGTIEASINRLDDPCTVYHQYNFGGDYPIVAQYYREVENVEIPIFCPALGDALDDGYQGDSETLSGTSGGYIIIPKGKYEFKLFTRNNRNKDVHGYISVKFHKLPENQGDQPLYVNTNVGGIRVKSIKEYNPNAQLLKKKYFNYNDIDGFSRGKELQKGISRRDYTVEYTCVNGINYLTYRFPRANFSYKSYNPVNLNQGVPVYYTQVKEYEERYTKSIPSYTPNPLIALNYDGTKVFRVISDPYARKEHYYTKGYTNTSFEYPIYAYQQGYPVVPNGVDKDMGRLNETTTYKFKKPDSIIQKITSTYQTYKHVRGLIDQEGNDYNPLHPPSLKIGYRIKREGIVNSGVYLNDYFIFKMYKEYDNLFLPKTKETTQYYPEQLKSLETNTYDSYDQLSKTEVEDSNGKVYSSEKQYPYDINEPVYNEMVNKNTIAYPVKNTSKVDATVLSSTKTEFYNLGGTLFKPKAKLSSKGNNALEPRLHIDRYDVQGNILEYHLVSKDNETTNDANNRYISIVWGYNNQYPIAKIENASYAKIISALGITEEALLAFNETNLATLNNLRTSLPEAMVTTYTYEPEVGVTTITDPKGYTTSYEYDDFQRLEYVKDAEGNLVSRNKYHYKN
ncbi:RHS repeat domain-containing protein [Aquimarina sp. 2304DJ70-9]|uniref:RHS repeat domain-containing protein n=1 Tax=Aquimarina penaris TaxID=3231044 RepID=UPI003462AE34